MLTEETQTSKEIKEISDKIGKLNLGEVSDLVENLKKKFNIQEQVVVGPATASSAPEKTEEKSSNVSVKLVEAGSEKIKVYNCIKENIKNLLHKEITLKEAMDLTKKEDQVILADIPHDQAEKFKKELEGRGAKVEIK
jgi:large subunit ribosomal protein L7/L12